MLRFAMIALFFGAAPIVAAAQAPELTRTRALALLSYDCGTADGVEAFRRGVLAVGASAQPLLLEVLTDGAPAEVRANEERRLSRRYDAMQAALETDAGAALAREGAPLPTREAFVADGLRRLNVRYRENAVRGLGVVGDPEVSESLRRAAETQPHLRLLVDAAILEINARGRR